MRIPDVFVAKKLEAIIAAGPDLGMDLSAAADDNARNTQRKDRLKKYSSFFSTPTSLSGSFAFDATNCPALADVTTIIEELKTSDVNLEDIYTRLNTAKT